MSASPDPKPGSEASQRVADPLSTRFFVVGCILLATAIGFGVWAFSLGCLTGHQPYILQYFLPLAAGFAAWTFSGSASARAQGLVPGIIITATGGFVVWLVSQYYLIPKTIEECQKQACSTNSPCVAIERLVDFSRSGCDPNGKAVDIERIDDVISIEPRKNNHSPPFMATATVLPGQAVDVYDLAKNDRNPVGSVERSSREINAKPFPVSVDDRGIARVRYDWIDANRTPDQGVAIIPPRPFRIARFKVDVVLPRDVKIDPRSVKFESPDGNVSKCNAADLSCVQVHGTSVDISWTWNLWERCPASQAV